MRRIYTLVVVTVIMLMVALTGSAHNEVESADSNGCDVTIVSAADIDAAEGMISEAPQVPQTIPVRRIVPTTTSSGFSMSRIVRLYHNLSLRQLAQCADKLLSSLCSKHSTVFTGTISPYNFTRSCDYYVYALRVIVI